MTWQLEQTVDEYRDYDLPIPDVNGHGGRVRLTINVDQRIAYLTVTLDNDQGDRFVESSEIRVPLPWALAITQGTDGFTLPPEEATA